MAHEYASSSRSSEQLRTPNEDDIDNELLIDEIQFRELLYDKTHPDFANLLRKNFAWEEIGEKLFFEVWHDLTEDQKAEACKSLQRRWKNIRACFSRELREQRKYSGPAAKRRRKYLHFERLSFLMNCLEEPKDPSSESAAPPEEEEGALAIDCEETPPEKRRKKPMKAHREEKLVERRQDVNNDVTTTNNKTDIFLELLERSNKIDQEKNFALSLVPLLRRIPKEKKLETEIKILQVIQGATE